MDEPRRNLPFVDLPNRPYPRSSAVRSLELAFDFKLRAEGRCSFLHDFVLLPVGTQSSCQGLPRLYTKSKSAKKPRFACSVTVRKPMQLYSTSLYPTPCTVSKCRGSSAGSPSFLRN